MSTSSRPIEILTRHDVERLLLACNRRSPSGLRDQALLALLYGSGLRISEALALRPRDINLDTGMVRVHRGKGGKARTSGLEVGMASLVRDWLVYRRDALGLGPSKPLFCQITKGRVGKPVTAAAVRQMLRRRSARAGLEMRVHAHGFRHSHAANMAREGVPMNVVQAQLGHSSLATTSRYLAHVAPADVVAAVHGMGPQVVLEPEE